MSLKTAENTVRLHIDERRKTAGLLAAHLEDRLRADLYGGWAEVFGDQLGPVCERFAEEAIHYLTSVYRGGMSQPTTPATPAPARRAVIDLKPL